MGGSRGLGHALHHFPIQVLEILKLREEEEEAHKLTISIYDTKRNEKSKEYREAMVSCPSLPRPGLLLDSLPSRVVRPMGIPPRNPPGGMRFLTP